MKPSDAQAFSELVAGVAAFYNQSFSEFANNVWWNAMAPYDFAAVADAFNRHAVNPDAGKFMPKPADIVRMLQGSTQDSALAAWAKVDRAIRTVGTYRSVVFDDALVHRVLADMGGWVLLGTRTEDEWPFQRNEFVNRYRGYRERSATPDYPKHLTGIAEAQNAREGMQVEMPVLIGDAERARDVYLGGSRGNPLQVTDGSALAQQATKRLPGRDLH
jgi:hypothetical protein